MRRGGPCPKRADVTPPPSPATAPAGSHGTGGPTGTTQFNVSCGVAVDTAGNVYVADSGNHRVRTIS